jgi:hypothetical protein
MLFKAYSTDNSMTRYTALIYRKSLSCLLTINVVLWRDAGIALRQAFGCAQDDNFMMVVVNAAYNTPGCFTGFGLAAGRGL